MPKNPEIDFSNTKQDRSKQTLDDLLQAAYEIVNAADPEKFTSRTLAARSGYSLGTLSQRLGSVENVFFWAIQKGREVKLNAYIKNMEQFDPKLTATDFVKIFVGKAFESINIVTPAVMRFYEQRYTQKYGLTNEYFDFIDILNEPYLELCRKNETNTFRALSQEEVKLIFRSILALIERPFINGNSIAGSEEHRRIAIDAIIGMLAKPNS